MGNVKFLLSGDTSLTVEFGNEISPEINAKIRAFNLALNRNEVAGIVETVPCYCSITIHYKPEIIRHNALVSCLEEIVGTLDYVEIPPSRIWEVPVLYGGEYGPDLDFVAQHTNKTKNEVINIHSAKEYLIYMLGFTPGFTYLGGMSSKLFTPRLKTPRVKIPAGSVGIAGEQTGVYPIESPGGWQLIGRTPVRMYDPLREKPILTAAGDYIKFLPIDEMEYKRIEALVAEGGYQCLWYPGKADKI